MTELTGTLGSGLRVGVVGLPGRWSTETLADELEERTGFRLIVDLANVVLDLDSGRCLYHDLDISTLDALVVKKIDFEYEPSNLDRVEILSYLERRGVPVFSRPRCFGRLINRLSCTTALRAADIPMPETTVTENAEAAAETILRYEGAVLKPLYSTKARGMHLVQVGDLEGARTAAKRFQSEGNRVMYIQKLIDMPDEDLGVVFLGEEYLTTYRRIRAEGAWNTTTRAGGSYGSHEIDAETLALARRARDLFELDFTVVDVVMTEDGPNVFEVSAFGGFRGILEGCGIDAAGAYVDYVLTNLKCRTVSA